MWQFIHTARDGEARTGPRKPPRWQRQQLHWVKTAEEAGGLFGKGLWPRAEKGRPGTVDSQAPRCERDEEPEHPMSRWQSDEGHVAAGAGRQSGGQASRKQQEEMTVGGGGRGTLDTIVRRLGPSGRRGAAVGC